LKFQGKDLSVKFYYFGLLVMLATSFLSFCADQCVQLPNTVALPTLMLEYTALASGRQDQKKPKVMCTRANTLFCLFDGLGDESHIPVQLCAENYYSIYKQSLGSVEERLSNTFAHLERHLIHHGPKNSGTAALLAKFSKGVLSVANVGDTRAILLRSTGVLSQILHTNDHVPTGNEKERLTRLGAWITASGHIANRDNPAGKTTMTRILGDAHLKQTMPEIIAIPEISSMQVQPNDVLLLLTQGLADPLDKVWRDKAASAPLLSSLLNGKLNAVDKANVVWQACARWTGTHGQRLSDNAAIQVVNVRSGKHEQTQDVPIGGLLLDDYFK
jgi:serine/threonine protein phosphatase PrpC